MNKEFKLFIRSFVYFNEYKHEHIHSTLIDNDNICLNEIFFKLDKHVKFINEKTKYNFKKHNIKTVAWLVCQSSKYDTEHIRIYETFGDNLSTHEIFRNYQNVKEKILHEENNNNLDTINIYVN